MNLLVSKPDHGVNLIKDGKASSVLQLYLDEIERLINDLINAGSGEFDEIVFDTKAAVEAANISITVNAIFISGYTTFNDGGGANYVRSASEPLHAGKIQSADGAWWDIDETEINVLMLGAVGDSTTDDSTAFNNALAVAGENGAVTIPCRTYNIAAQVDIIQIGMTLMGLGRPTLLRGANIIPLRLNANGVTVEEIIVNGKKATFTSADQIIRIENRNDCRIHDCEVFGGPNAGIAMSGSVSGSSGHLINNNHVHGCDGVGISTNTNKNSIITSNRTQDCGLEGITLDIASTGNVCSGNRIISCCIIGGVGGIGVDDAELNSIFGNIVTGTGSGLSGLKTQNNIGASNQNAIVGNVFSGNGAYGLHLSTNGGAASSENTVMGNVMFNNTSGALLVDASSIDNVLWGNVTSREVVDVTDQNNTQTEPVSFFATLSTQQNNATGDATAFTIPFDTEVRDYGSSFNTGTGIFTAPITGRYVFCGGARMIGGASGIQWVQIIITTSNRGYRNEFDVTDENTMAPTISIVADMQKGDTAILRARASATGGKIVDISNDSEQTFFSGDLLG